ncbi:MAG: hypothetical protein JO078_09890 [Candidatus Eremiobacteraeota bacterium]|nr:hypothetical protein [Candidatus Eremiobacteraeota bacterium]
MLLRILAGASFVVLMTGCGGGYLSAPRVAGVPQSIHPPAHKHVFHFTGAAQTLEVPAGITKVMVVAEGASGASCVTTNSTYCYGSGIGGNGGFVRATIAVTPSETLYVYVGGHNGWNGGARGKGSSFGYFNGGGESDVRQGGSNLKDRVVVAGGGGGGGSVSLNSGGPGNGGAGGGTTGAAGGWGGFYGDGGGGGGGTQTAGGSGGAGGCWQNSCGHDAQRTSAPCRECGQGPGGAGRPGKFHFGGQPSLGGSTIGGAGGGGGGGWYGGGGGGSGAWSYFGPSFTDGSGGGGGGGSSFVEKHAGHVKHIQGGAPPGDGKIVISW